MNSFIQFVLSIIILCIWSNELYSNDNVDFDIKEKLNGASTQSSSQGTLFYVCFPGNDRPNGLNQKLAVYITALEDTRAYLTNEYLGVSIAVEVKANKVTELSSLNNELSWNWEIWESEVIEKKAFQITSDKPITVYLMNAKANTTEGYLAIPVSNWGIDYFHCSFYDFNEAYSWAGGFTIIASENNTKVTIKLSSGVDAPDGQTQDKRKVGYSINTTLKKGETYSVIGDGLTRGTFDMSGTRITSNKPVGVVSFHQRCMIPSFIVTNGRNHLSEMIPPTQSWGKTYASIELPRSGGNGDFMRVISSEDNTEIRVKWWELVTNKLIEEKIDTLNKGEIFEYNSYASQGSNNPHYGVRGMSLIEANNPILVMQYCYSDLWDESGCAFDPLMFRVLPVSDYSNKVLFQVPVSKVDFTEYNYNMINIIASGDTSDLKRNMELLKSVKINGIPVYNLDPSFVLNIIPSTNLYWARVQANKGTSIFNVDGNYVVEGDTKIGGYIFGYGNCDSYAWHAATYDGDLFKTDTLAPLLSWEGKCGIYKIGVIDDPDFVADPPRKGKEGDFPIQWDQGLSDQPIIFDNNNFLDPYPIDDNGKKRENWSGYPIEFRMNWRYEVENKYKDGFIKFAYRDASILKNTTIDSLRYEADSLVLISGLVNFDKVRVDSTSTLNNIEIESHSDSVITIKNVYLKTRKEFKLKNMPTGVLSKRGDKLNIEMTYSPTVDWPNLPTQRDFDSLVVETECLRWAWLVEGRGVEPQILVQDWDAGQRQPLTRNIKFGGFKIENNGTTDLEVTGIKSIKDVEKGNVELVNKGTITNFQDIKKIMNSNFEWDSSGVKDENNNIINFPFTVASNNYKILYDLYYVPQSEGIYEFDVLFEHNAKAGNTKDISKWFGWTTITNIENDETGQSLTASAYPNPIIDGTTINVNIIEQSQISITIYDLLGNEVIKLLDNQSIDIPTQYTWYGKNALGEEVNAGIYLCNINYGNERHLLKLHLLK